MIIRAKAPLRVSFGGGGTDISPYCDENVGCVISSTINKYAYCSIVPNDSNEITVHSLDFDMTVKYNIEDELNYDGKLALVKAALKEMNIEQGCEVYLSCDAPAGSGLGTSSTVVVALLAALARWKNVELDKYELAELAYRVERQDLGISGGYQDQYAATFGGFNFIEFYGQNDIVVNSLKVKREIINELEHNLLLCYTGKIHVSANIINDQMSNYKKKEIDVIKAMEEIKALSIAMKKELLKGNLNNFGKLLNLGWINKKKMSNKITSVEIDDLYDEAIKAGALGGKLLGAGGGGYLLVYCPYNKKHIIAEKLQKVGGQIMDWNFEFKGVQTWVMNEQRENRIKDIKVLSNNKKFRFNVSNI